MSAQYRPYRDEDSVDGLETTAWSDNEPGSIQIYEKTTEELPFNGVNKRTMWIQIALLVLVGVLGFLLGFFGPLHGSTISLQPASDTSASEADSPDHYAHDFYIPEDPSIKDKLLASINSRQILELLERYQDTNRIPGSPDEQKFVNHIQNLFYDFGVDQISTSNQTFSTQLPEKPHVVSLHSSNDDVIYSTASEKYPHDDMRPFLPLSQARRVDITAKHILYVNKGTREDYSKLVSMGVSLNETEGKFIVLRLQYYKAYDAIVTAQENGAKAVLVFPDPDIYGSSSPFPKSVQLPNDAAQFHPKVWSSYGDLAYYNLSAAVGVDASKLGFDKEAKIQVPVIPISFDTAKILLRGLSGPQAPNDWNCFDFTLYVGPGYREENNEDHRSSVRISFNNRETTITTTYVTGIIIGAVEPDRYIILGSRRDSLNRGLLDSVSGTAVMMEIARAFGSLKKQGWRPRRTIMFNSFGAESLNLIGSSNWLTAHQRLLYARTVAYINCDLVVTGNHSVAIAASPMLYQVVYNATRQVANPSVGSDHKTVYDAWIATHNTTNHVVDADLEKVFEDTEIPTSKLTKEAHDEMNEDSSGIPGSILQEYRKSAFTKVRPKINHIDLHSMYSPFFLFAGIPFVDVRYSCFESQASNVHSNLVEDMMPIIGSKYDNLAAIQKVDPTLSYHVATAKILAEVLRDLSDSSYLPYNLLDYAVTLKNNYLNFVSQNNKTFAQSNIDLEPLKESIVDFAKAAVKFHHRQDLANYRDNIQVRRFNDQLMLLERAFLDPQIVGLSWDRKHAVLSPNDGHDHKEGFPGLVDLIGSLESDDIEPSDRPIFVELLKLHYRTVILTIEGAVTTIEEPQIL